MTKKTNSAKNRKWRKKNFFDDLLLETISHFQFLHRKVHCLRPTTYICIAGRVAKNLDNPSVSPFSL